MPNPKPSSLSQRKHATQERAGATVDAIVEAAARILASDGAPGLTTNRIARVAGVSIGSVYQYFPNKEAIVVALIETQLRTDKHVLEHTIAKVQNTSTSPNLASAMRSVIEHICEHQHRLAPLLAKLLPLLPQLRQEQLVHQRMEEMGGLLETLLVAHVQELRPELGEPQQRRRTVSVVVNALRGALNAALHSPERLLTVEFKNDVCALALGALLKDE